MSIIDRGAPQSFPVAAPERRPLVGLFSKPKPAGLLEFGFTPRNGVIVRDEIPPAGEPVPYYILCPFLFAGKLFYNFPGGSGRFVADTGFKRLSARATGNSLEEINISIFETCSIGFHWAQPGEQAKWTYRADFFPAGGLGLTLKTNIPWGNEDSLHRATIDAAFEYARQKAGDKGGAVVAGAAFLLSSIADHGVENIPLTILDTQAAAKFTAEAIKTGTLPS
jgi:hypothetical protein